MHIYLQQGYEWIPTSSTSQQHHPTKLDIYNHPMVIKGEREGRKAGDIYKRRHRKTYNTIRRERERGEKLVILRNHKTYNTIRREREREEKSW